MTTSNEERQTRCIAVKDEAGIIVAWINLSQNLEDKAYAGLENTIGKKLRKGKLRVESWAKN